MTPLSELVDEALARELRAALERGQLPGMSYKHAMEFLLSDGIVTAADLLVRSLLELQDWVRQRSSGKSGAPR